MATKRVLLVLLGIAFIALGLTSAYFIVQENEIQILRKAEEVPEPIPTPAMDIVYSAYDQNLLNICDEVRVRYENAATVSAQVEVTPQPIVEPTLPPTPEPTPKVTPIVLETIPEDSVLFAPSQAPK